ncbi:MAG: autotransporter outer membrane beta-barrel domain-containing protein [Pseudomonadota bacterium]
MAAGAGGNEATAGSCAPLVGANIVCSGAADAGGNDMTQVLSGGGGPVSVTTADGFGIDTSTDGGDALTITGDGGLTFDDTNVDGSAITGAEDGIDATNSGGGALSITTKGTVTGVAGDGIYARNYTGGSDLTISAAAVSGSGTGIYARNSGDGSILVTATDAVSATGNGSEGIRVRNDIGTYVTIATAGVSAASTGIAAQNLGSGDLTITTSGPIAANGYAGISASNTNGGAMVITATDTISSNNRGIVAENGVGGSTLSISTADVVGDTEVPINGMLVYNFGTGDLSISSSGRVDGGVYAGNYNGGSLSISVAGAAESTYAYGISAKNGAGGSHLTISAAAASGMVNGIYANNQGTGNLSITATDSVSSTDASGIFALNDALISDLKIVAADVSGGTNGIEATLQGKGALSITVSGTVSGGSGSGIDTDAQNGEIVLTATAAAMSDAGVAVTDGNGATVLSSRGALAGQVLMNGGDDTVNLVAGSATDVIDMGGGQDEIRIFGANANGGWIDLKFGGTFDNNKGQVLQLDGGAGFDLVSLFGVVASGQALGTGTDIEALALLDRTVLQANSLDLRSFGLLFVGPESTLQAEGNSPSETIVGPLINAGIVDLQDGAANDLVTVDGDYTGGEGSQIWLDFDGNTGTADVIVVNGKIVDHDPIDIGGRTFEAESGPTEIHINAFGRGARPGEADVRLIEVAGEADADDFFLARPVELDIFDYELVFEDGAFVLASDFLDQIYTYENLPGAMQTIGLALTGQLVERVGVRSAVPSTLTDAAGNPVPGGAPVDTALWGRAVGLSLDSEGDLDSFTGSSFEQTIGFLQAGIDVTVLERSSGRLLIGALGHWGTSSLEVSDFDGDAAGGADFDFYGGGLTATWYSTAGWYFYNVFQYTAYDVDISGGARFGTTSTDGYGIAVSHELGYRLPIGDAAALVPQAQITYQHIDFDDFTDPDGVRVSLGDGDSLVGRLGVAFENSAAIGSALATGYVEANLLHEFLGDNSVDVARGPFGAAIDQDLGGTSVELGFGGTVAVSRGVSLYAEVDYTIPFDDGLQGVQALGGIRVNLNPPPPPPPPAPVIAPVAETAFIVFFDWDQADLTSEANLVLDDVVMVANQSGYASIRLDGYTDLSGSAAYNLGLSERRANSVANALIARGIAPDEIVIRAFGEENPLVPTPDGVREPQNRRVEIFLS